MPFSRRMSSRRTTSRRGRGSRYGSRGGLARAPKISKYDAQEIRLEKANFDVRPMLYTTFYGVATPGVYAVQTATAAGDCQFASCPLYNLTGASMNSTNGASIKTNYTEYRMKKITCHVMVKSVTSGYVATSSEVGIGDTFVLGTAATKTTFTTNVSAVVVSVAWGRNGAWAATPTGMSTDSMSLLPQCKQWVWNLTCIEKPEFWTQLTADGGGESDWLSTAVVPTSAPNTGRFFCPILSITVGGLPASVGTCTLYCEEEAVVETRGSKF